MRISSWTGPVASLAILAAACTTPGITADIRAAVDVPPPLSLDAPVSATHGATRTPPRNEFTERLLLLRFGQRQYDEDDFWFPLDEPIVFAFEHASRAAGSPLGWEAGFSFGADYDDRDVLGIDTDFFLYDLEGSLGMRLTADTGPVQFYVGGGGAIVLIGFSIEEDDAMFGSNTILDENDFTFGYYAHTGVLFRVAPHFVVGLDGRIRGGTDIEFDGFADTDADYGEVTFVFGWAP